MEHNLKQRQLDLEEQLGKPWDFAYLHYRQLDGWEINKNRISRDKYLLEVAKELGSTTIPHWER
ncbi:MAG TPA: hypothetical protein DDW87_00965 [Firmicutes bacterium]|nr:hypothetical protein [Bacillota bacterium]